jgi:uncharacterized lipoprotein YmbA
MKRFLLFALLAVTLAACNTTQTVTNYFTTHCPESTVLKQPDGTFKVYLKCTELYDTTEIAKYLTEGRITYDFRQASFTGTVTSADSIPDMQKILTAIVKGVKKKP